MKLAVCQNCGMSLCAIEVPNNVQIRCSSCGHIAFQPSSDDDCVQMDSAWRSLWLGLASIILLFITGIPAVYYGIKALLKMRYQKVTSATKFAAIFGVAIGGVWGVMIGGTASATIGFGIFAAVLSGSTTIADPELAAEHYNTIAQFEIPEESNLKVRLAKLSKFRRSYIEFWDDEKFEDSRNRFYLSYWNAFFTSQMGSIKTNRNNMRKGAVDRILGNWDDKLEKGEESTLDWMIHGQSLEVTKTRYFGTIGLEEENGSDDSEPAGEAEIVDAIPEELDLVTYQCLFDVDENTVCFTMMTSVPNPQLTETHIQAIFESYQPVRVKADEDPAE